MDTPSKEQIRKAKKSEANKRFRERVKTEKESSQDTESIKSDSQSSVFFLKLAELAKQNLIQVTIFTIIPLVGKTIISKVMSNTLRLSSNGVTQPEKEPDLLPQVGYLPANF